MVSKEAVKAESKQLRDYELVLIISPEVVDEKFDAVIDNISGFIARDGGIVSDVERWGKKRLAYPIENFIEGSYVLIRLKLGTTRNKELEVNLRVSDEVLRYLLINLSS